MQRSIKYETAAPPEIPPSASEIPARRGVAHPPAVLPLKRTGLQLVNVEVRYRAVTPEGLPGVFRERAVPFDEQHYDVEANDKRGERDFEQRKAVYFLEPSIVDFSASVKPGERIGIVGRTGAGKNVITRFDAFVPFPYFLNCCIHNAVNCKIATVTKHSS